MVRPGNPSLPQEAREEPLAGDLVRGFLADLEQANRPFETRRAYGAELARLVSFHPGTLRKLTAETLLEFFATRSHLSPASRARTQAAVASFLGWAYRHEWLEATPMARVERVRQEPPRPRWLPRAQIEAILGVIPATRRRDRLLFRLIVECGLRAGEALKLHVEDLDFTPDDEHVSILGKGNRRRTLLLDDPQLVAALRTYLKQTGYQAGPLFRAEKNGRGGPLRYQSAQARWAGYCSKAGIRCTLHQLRHSHATELVNDGVSLATIRKRLGHKNLQTTLRYADQSDSSSDAELRAWRRQRGQPRSISSPARTASLASAGQRSSESALAGHEHAPATAPKSLMVRFHLNVQNDNRWGRNRKWTKEEIEEYCLRSYEYRKLDRDGVEYEVSVPYENETDLNRQIQDLILEITNTAADRRCNVEMAVWSADDPGRVWV